MWLRLRNVIIDQTVTIIFGWLILGSVTGLQTRNCNVFFVTTNAGFSFFLLWSQLLVGGNNFSTFFLFLMLNFKLNTFFENKYFLEIQCTTLNLHKINWYFLCAHCLKFKWKHTDMDYDHIFWPESEKLQREDLHFEARGVPETQVLDSRVGLHVETRLVMDIDLEHGEDLEECFRNCFLDFKIIPRPRFNYLLHIKCKPRLGLLYSLSTFTHRKYHHFY